MDLDRRLKKTFGEVSDLYNSARASYPIELIEDIIKISKVSGKSKILEIGCGSGKATCLFAQKGYEILGIDISKELIEFAKKNSLEFENVSYKVTSFEDVVLQPNTFDLITSAQAWHWLNPEVAYKKAYDLLTGNGFLALFWKNQEYGKLDFLKKLRKLYIKYCPKYRDPMAVKGAEKELLESGLFYPFEKKEYFVELKYDKEKYIQMVSTMSWVIALSGESKGKFFLELKDLMEQQNEVFFIPYRYTLLIARKK